MAGCAVAGVVASFVVARWALADAARSPGLLAAVVLLVLTWWFPIEATADALGWLSVDRGLTGRYLPVAAGYVEFGHAGGAWSVPWSAVQAFTIARPGGVDADVVQLKVEASGWGPFTASKHAGMVQILTRDTDIDVGLLAQLVNFATAGRLDPSWPPPSIDTTATLTARADGADGGGGPA